MQCNTRFTFPYENHEVNQKMDCETALKFMQNARSFAVYGYVSRIEIHKQHTLLSSYDRYLLLSSQQFECLLTCSSITKNWAQYRICRKDCLNKTENVILSDLDAFRYRKDIE